MHFMVSIPQVASFTCVPSPKTTTSAARSSFGPMKVHQMEGAEAEGEGMEEEGELEEEEEEEEGEEEEDMGGEHICMMSYCERLMLRLCFKMSIV
jgi:hypothetical protein